MSRDLMLINNNNKHKCLAKHGSPELSDIFTKGLTHDVFEYLRKKIMGW